MKITLYITEDSRVELVRDGCEAVQGEHNATTLILNLPETIKGYSIDNYQRNIEFKECKDFGECAKFYDVVEGDTYNLCSTCTQYKKIMIQFTLTNRVDEAEPIVWKTIPFALEFKESINAENAKEVQVALLSLQEILDEWETYIKANTLRMVYRAGDVPTADVKSAGDTIFYLGANTTEPYALEYGYYYRCELVDGEYSWVNIVKDPSIGDVSNGIKEINKNAIIQFWQGTQEELDNEVKQPNVFYIPTDQDAKAEIDEILKEMAADEKYKLAYPFVSDGQHVKYFGGAISRRHLLTINNESKEELYYKFNIVEQLEQGDKLEIVFEYDKRQGVNADGETQYTTKTGKFVGHILRVDGRLVFSVFEPVINNEDSNANLFLEYIDFTNNGTPDYFRLYFNKVCIGNKQTAGATAIGTIEPLVSKIEFETMKIYKIVE